MRDPVNTMYKNSRNASEPVDEPGSQDFLGGVNLQFHGNDGCTGIEAKARPDDVIQVLHGFGHKHEPASDDAAHARQETLVQVENLAECGDRCPRGS